MITPDLDRRHPAAQWRAAALLEPQGQVHVRSAVAVLDLQRERARRRVVDDQIAVLFRRRAAIQQEERSRIARDVHDHVGQQVTALRMQLELLSAQCESHPAVREQLRKTQHLAEALDRGLDALILQLRPATPPDAGFAAALSAFVSDWSEQFGIAAECETFGDAGRRLQPEAAAHLQAIVQEALHNVVKHARATSVNVSLTRRGDRAVLVVEDNGRGFTPSRHAGADAGFGLVTMRERAELAGGGLEVESSPGGGTTIYVRLML